MWCKHCRQDVPALSTGEQPTLRCSRCGQGLESERPAVAEPAAAYDGWEMDEQLRHIGRALQNARVKSRQAEAIYHREAARFDLPHAGPTPWHASTAASKRKASKPSPRNRGFVSTALTWIALSSGIIAFVCGATLLGWSIAANRQELWTVGLPMTLVGQVALLIGLVLQLERLWRSNREASAKLDEVDEQLGDLKASTTLLGTSHGPAASVFYSHFAGGAGPQLLLTDLKSQIDLLAMRIAQDEQ